MQSHEYYMQQVLNLVKLVDVQTRPNPRVGAIVVANDEIVGIAAHLFAGDPHAEVYALQQAGKRAVGATLYVNLEPCAHFGRTPPCANLVVESGITKVVIASLDPNPLVAGQGVAILEAAGIEVIIGVCRDEALLSNQVFFHNIATNMPYVTLKAGLSLDGRIATKENLSQWITCMESRRDAHQYRVTHEAILVGINTVIQDDPSLTAHLLSNPRRNPIRVILDHNLRTPLTSKLVTDSVLPTWIYTTNNDLTLQQKYNEHGVQVICLANLELDIVLRDLYQKGVYSLLVEGGEQIYSSFIDAKLVNQIVCYYSPQLIGSKQAKHFYAGTGFANLQDNLQLKVTEVAQLGNDVKIVSQVIKS